jgi:hypothetical protein
VQNKIWDGTPAELGILVVRGAWHAVDTASIAILNFRLADIPEGGDPAFMVYHHLYAYFPEQKNQLLKYYDIDFSFDPSSSVSIATQERKVQKVLLALLK